MNLFYEGSLIDTYYMAEALLRSFEVLEEQEHFEHFSNVIGSFCEIFGAEYWSTDFDGIEDLRGLKYQMGKVNNLNEVDLYALRLVNTTIALLDPKTKDRGIL